MIKNFEEFVFESYNCGSFEIKKRSDLNPLNESQESESQKSAIKLVMDKFGWDKDRANKFIRVDLRNDIPSLRDKKIGKFTLGVTRMYVDGELKDASIISDINATLKLLSAHLNEYDRNLNGLSAEELISKFKKVRDNNVKKEKQEISKMKFGISEYEIVKIDSFNDATKYYKYTNPNSRWCLTYMDDMYNSYTCGGINQLYFCLKNGFEDIKPIEGEDAPLDEYGLSMLSVIVNGEGELAYCTCRWNHDNGGNDSIMSAVEISDIVNVDFYETFKPSGIKWEDVLDNVKNRLSKGELIEDVFDEVYEEDDDIYKVKISDKFNFVNTEGKILLDTWFDGINTGKFNDYNRAAVKLNNKWNIININNGEYLLDTWFDEINTGEFDDYNRTAVKLNNKWNIININNGEYLLDKWFDRVDKFINNYVLVKLNNKWNILNTDNGEYLLDKWVDFIWDFMNGGARVELNSKYNILNTDCKYLLDKWVEYKDLPEEYIPKSLFIR